MNSFSAPPYPNNLRKLLEDRGISQVQFANETGWGTVNASRKINGLVSVTPPQLRQLNELYGWSASQIYEENYQSPRIVYIVGVVGAGAHIFPYEDYTPGTGEETECPPGADPKTTVALRVKGDSMMPFMPDGTLVFYSERRYGDYLDYLNKLCVVQVKNGPTLLKTLKKGYTKGRFNLMSYNAEMIEDAQLEWCAKIIFIKLV